MALYNRIGREPTKQDMNSIMNWSNTWNDPHLSSIQWDWDIAPDNNQAIVLGMRGNMFALSQSGKIYYSEQTTNTWHEFIYLKDSDIPKYFKSLFFRDQMHFTIPSINANSELHFEVTLPSKENYTPLSITSFDTLDLDNKDNIISSNIFIRENNTSFRISFFNADVITHTNVTVNFIVLYIRQDLIDISWTNTECGVTVM